MSKKIEIRLNILNRNKSSSKNNFTSDYFQIIILNFCFDKEDLDSKVDSDRVVMDNKVSDRVATDSKVSVREAMDRTASDRVAMGTKISDLADTADMEAIII